MKSLREVALGVFPQLVAIGIVIILGGFLVAVMGVSPIKAGIAFLDGAFGGLNSIGETLLKSTPLLLASLGVAIAFRAQAWNIGAEGQILVGALAATAVALGLGPISAWIHIPIAIIVACLAGGFWGAIAGYIKNKFGVNEIISTLMMNYIAFFLNSALLHGPMKTKTQFYPETDYIPDPAQLQVILPGSRLHAGILIALAASVLVYFLMFRTVFGYRIRAVGDNPDAARLGGISVGRWVVISLFFSGALAGLGGFTDSAGVHQRLIEKLSPGYGYTAIMIALMGRLHPGGIVAAAIFVGALLVGADNMQRAAGVPSVLADILVGLSVLSILISSYYPILLNFLRRRFASGLA